MTNKELIEFVFYHEKEIKQAVEAGIAVYQTQRRRTPYARRWKYRLLLLNTVPKPAAGVTA